MFPGGPPSTQKGFVFHYRRHPKPPTHGNITGAAAKSAYAAPAIGPTAPKLDTFVNPTVARRHGLSPSTIRNPPSFAGVPGGLLPISRLLTFSSPRLQACNPLAKGFSPGTTPLRFALCEIRRPRRLPPFRPQHAVAGRQCASGMEGGGPDDPV